MRGRGLKLAASPSSICSKGVALRARARIETLERKSWLRKLEVALRARARIETHLQAGRDSRQEGSPSVRGRGLKLREAYNATPAIGSPSVRGRGLKLKTHQDLLRAQIVALRARARIETEWKAGEKGINPVALRARARIETATNDCPAPTTKSPSVRGRGLKRTANCSGCSGAESPSVRGRGLKPIL